METRTFQERWLDYQKTVEQYANHVGELVNPKFENPTTKYYHDIETERLKRKIEYLRNELDHWGEGTIFQVTFEDGSTLMLVNIQRDDIESLVKYKYKNVAQKTINIKELEAGIILNKKQLEDVKKQGADL